MDPLTILKWLQFIEAEAPNVIALIRKIFASGKTITDYLNDATANNTATLAAAQTQIQADLEEIAAGKKSW